MAFEELFSQALERRKQLEKKLAQEHTDSWRVFHGVAEGRAGLNADRYGSCLIAQSFREPLSSEELGVLSEYASQESLKLSVWDKKLSAGTLSERKRTGEKGVFAPFLCREQGQVFYASDRPQGLDPYFYLDFRTVRRWLRREVKPGERALNLFAYTCTAGAAACFGGGESVNVDFGRWCLEVGKENARLSNLQDRMTFVNEDFFPVIWQMSGAGVKGRRARRPYLKIKPCLFDYIILDPPTVAKSYYGKVDIAGDYPSLLKPSLACLKDGGTLIASNHAADVCWEEWQRTILRTAEKAGFELEDVQALPLEEDFPNSGSEPLLKLAIIKKAGKRL